MKHNSTVLIVSDLWEKVVTDIGVGNTESVYQRALVLQLVRHGIPVRAELPCPVIYEGECIGFGRADIVVPGLVLELKMKNDVSGRAHRQVASYVRSLQSIEGVSYQGMVLTVDPEKGSPSAELIPRLAHCSLGKRQRSMVSISRKPKNTTQLRAGSASNLFTKTVLHTFGSDLKKGRLISRDKLVKCLLGTQPGPFQKGLVNNYIKTHFKIETTSKRIGGVCSKRKRVALCRMLHVP